VAAIGQVKGLTNFFVMDDGSNSPEILKLRHAIPNPMSTFSATNKEKD